MGTRFGGDGGERPPDGNGGERPAGDHGVPELPPEWGRIIIPDDPSALADEAAPVQRQLRRYARSRRWRRRLRLPPPPLPVLGQDPEPGLGVPLLVMAIAIIATMASLFALGWPTPRRPTAGPGPAASSTALRRPAPIGTLTLADAAGGSVRLADALPAVILVVDNCPCHQLIRETAGAAGAAGVTRTAGPRVTVLAVAPAWSGAAPAADQTGAAPVRRLIDPGGAVRAALPGLTDAPPPAAALIAADGTPIKLVRDLNSVDDFRADLPRLLG